jgi:hypothetical protein
MNKLLLSAAVAVAITFVVPSAQADTFNFTSCELSRGCGTAPFGTVTLTQSGTSVNFDVTVNSSEFRLRENSQALSGGLFLFNDSLSGSTITSIASAPGTPTGGFSGFTNVRVQTGNGRIFTAAVVCTNFFNCPGAGPTITSLTFTVTNATLAQLETPNPNSRGTLFLANIQHFSPTGGQTGTIDVSAPATPLPAALPLFATGLGALGLLGRRRKRKAQAVA